MPLTTQAQNWIVEAMHLAETMLDVQNENLILRARATVNNLAAEIADDRLEETNPQTGGRLYPSFEHLARAELVDALTVFTDFVAWMGDPNDSASRAAKLLRLRG
ncbi:MAG: hypothetical protein IAE80_19805 [Anaerolinea sp.]|nr:hypothetical protein [Anaerolinea sp.]